MKIFYKLRDYFNLLGQASFPKTNCVLGNNIICLFILFNSNVISSFQVSGQTKIILKITLVINMFYSLLLEKN